MGRIEEKQEGKVEATIENIFELLEDLGEVSEALRGRIADLEDLESLKMLHKLAARADSVHAFEEEAQVYFVSNEE